MQRSDQRRRNSEVKGSGASITCRPATLGPALVFAEMLTWCLRSRRRDPVSRKTVPKGRLIALISLMKFGASEGIRSLDPNLSNEEMARPTRFERVASTFGGWRSIQLSYGRISHCLVRPTSSGQRIREFNFQRLSKLAGSLRPNPLRLSGSCLRRAYAEKYRPWVIC